MKRINLKGLREVLSEKELKNVMGGSGTVGDGICIAYQTFNGTGDYCCSNDANEAAEAAGDYGWWCCNCEDARQNCDDIIWK